MKTNENKNVKQIQPNMGRLVFSCNVSVSSVSVNSGSTVTVTVSVSVNTVNC